MKGPVFLIAVLAVLGVSAQQALAFQDQPPASTSSADKPAEAPKASADPGKGLSLKMPEMSLGKGAGTEVRIPGIGTVGVLPKLDFGLELLYGATESRTVRPDDKS